MTGEPRRRRGSAVPRRERAGLGGSAWCEAQHFDGVDAACFGCPPPWPPWPPWPLAAFALSGGQPASVPWAAAAPAAPAVAAVPALAPCAVAPWPSVVPPVGTALFG